MKTIKDQEQILADIDKRLRETSGDKARQMVMVRSMVQDSIVRVLRSWLERPCRDKTERDLQTELYLRGREIVRGFFQSDEVFNASRFRLFWPSTRAFKSFARAQMDNYLAMDAESFHEQDMSKRREWSASYIGQLVAEYKRAVPTLYRVEIPLCYYEMLTREIADYQWLARWEREMLALVSENMQREESEFVDYLVDHCETITALVDLKWDPQYQQLRALEGRYRLPGGRTLGDAEMLKMQLRCIEKQGVDVFLQTLIHNAFQRKYNADKCEVPTIEEMGFDKAAQYEALLAQTPKGALMKELLYRVNKDMVVYLVKHEVNVVIAQIKSLMRESGLITV